eukprot:gene23177-28048_t
MWQGIDYACRTVAMEDPEQFEKYRDKEVWVKTNPKGEGERSLQFFTHQCKGATPAEQLFSKDGKLIGVNLPASEFLHLEDVTYITQSAWLEHVGEGGHSERDSRTNTLYDERRKVYTAMQRARHTAYDVLEEVREVYVTPGPVTTESRSHRPNQVRSMGKRTKTRVTIDEPGTPTPAIKLLGIKLVGTTDSGGP